jgi:hypothetical protein
MSKNLGLTPARAFMLHHSLVEGGRAREVKRKRARNCSYSKPTLSITNPSWITILLTEQHPVTRLPLIRPLTLLNWRLSFQCMNSGAHLHHSTWHEDDMR